MSRKRHTAHVEEAVEAVRDAVAVEVREAVRERLFGESPAVAPEPAEPVPAGEAPAEDRAPDFTWSGQPVYRCRVCGRYERVGNLAAVLKHEATHATPAPAVRESRILGSDGAPLVIEEEA
ncbi:MAG: hypothetical protein JW767_04715 [Thermoleophilia bacterium]|nr:hypothetical protein [Thermoleophilia bacterium]